MSARPGFFLPDFIETGIDARDAYASLRANEEWEISLPLAKIAVSMLIDSNNLFRIYPANRLPQAFFDGHLEKREVFVGYGSVSGSVSMVCPIWQPNLRREKIAST